MKKFSINSIAGEVIFEGRFKTFSACIEQAVSDKINLSCANFRNANLANITLDDATLPGADFVGANLTGANISEASLRGVNFAGAALFNTCLAWSDIRNCNFENADFGATDITGADISGSLFSTLSCFKLNFTSVQRMEDCVFKNVENILIPMTQPPIVINGLCNIPTILADHHILCGHKKIDMRALMAMLKTHLSLEYKRKLA